MPEFGGDNSPSRVRKRTALDLLLLPCDVSKFLSPACGSANFLYIAYREIKRLEAIMFELFNDISLQNTQFNLDAFTFIYPENMFGFEIEEWSASVGISCGINNCN